MHIIYHLPLPLDKTAKSASGIRPIKILEAFYSLGYEVDIVCGYLSERKRAVNEIFKKIESGIKYDFCYSESSTMPTLLTEKNHLPHFDNPDFKLFKFCKKNSIPVRLFYRDIYWCFPDYYKQVGLKGYIAKFFYKYDVRQYLKYIETLYVPCFRMLDYIPALKKLHCEELPSGCIIQNIKETVEQTNSSIYVGGIGNHYDLHKLVHAYTEMENEQLLLCVREDDWNAVKETYSVSENIKVVHASGDELKKLYSYPNKSMLFVEPSTYREFAIPYKLFEYMGWGLPIIASGDTAVGSYVEKNNIGWTIPYTEEALQELLKYLDNHPEDLIEKQKNIKKAALENTWQKRCEQISRIK